MNQDVSLCSLAPALAETEFLDFRSAAVQSFVARVADNVTQSDRERAVSLYYAVRDELFYEIYNADFSRQGLRASSILEAGTGLCIHKSVVYASALRAIGIPSRLVLTDVRNHMTSERLRAFVGGDVFHYHCLVSLYLEGRWLRATPVFNALLCKMYRMTPLEFDGTADSLHHPYDENGNRTMEFLHEHGTFNDLPYDALIAGLHKAHPNLFAERHRFLKGSLTRDAKEVRA